MSSLGDRSIGACSWDIAIGEESAADRDGAPASAG